MEMDIFKILLSLGISLANYPILVSLFAGIFAGEIAALTLSFLAAQGVMPFWIVFTFMWVGEIIGDMIYFEIGRLRFFHKLRDFKKFGLFFGKVDKFISQISKESIFLTLLYSKFVYGSRTAVVIFLGMKKANRLKFFLSECVVMAIVLLILLPIGFAAGKGYSFIMDNFKSIQIAISFLIVLIIAFVFGQEKLNEFLLLKKEQLKKWLIKRK